MLKTKNTGILLILIASLIMVAARGKKMVKIKLDKNVTIYLPDDFIVMSDDDIAKRYPAYRKPIAMYTNPDGKVDFGYNVTNSSAWGNDITLLKKFYRSTVMSMYSKVEFIQDTIIKRKKRDYIVFEYTSEVEEKQNTTQPIPPIKNYTYISYTLQQGEVYVFNFNCPYRLKDQWRYTADDIIKSVKVNLVPNKHEIKVIKKPAKETKK